MTLWSLLLYVIAASAYRQRRDGGYSTPTYYTCITPYHDLITPVRYRMIIPWIILMTVLFPDLTLLIVKRDGVASTGGHRRARGAGHCHSPVVLFCAGGWFYCYYDALFCYSVA